MTPDDVLDFWFAGVTEDVAAAGERMSVWFQSDATFDAEVNQQFAAAIAPAAGGEYSEWARSARECLALVIMLDQFPRNVYRGSAEAFNYDALALGLTIVGLKLGYLEELEPIEQVFFLMPYQHVEDLQKQQEGFALFERIAAESSAEWQPLLGGCRDFANVHLEIIEQFGRFPHRNEALRRQSTEAEQAYLQQGGESFGQNRNQGGG